MKHTFIQNERAEGTGLVAILGLIGAVVVAVVYFAIIPMIGSKIDTTAIVPAGSAWNTTENPSLPTGAGLWNDVGGMIVIAFVIAAVAIVIYMLRAGF
jgi:hypothetical protein